MFASLHFGTLHAMIRLRVARTGDPPWQAGFIFSPHTIPFANMKRSWIAVFLFSALALAQSYQTGTVLKWEMKPYSQSAHIIRDHVVYSIRVGGNRYEIARRSKDVEMTNGQQVECRIRESTIYVRNAKGKEIKYEIVGTEPAD